MAEVAAEIEQLDMLDADTQPDNGDTQAPRHGFSSSRTAFA